MTRRMLALGAIAAALPGLAGCDGGGGETAERRKAPEIRIRNKHHEDLVALPDNLRRIGLMRAIRDTGNRCPLRVESAVHQGEHEGLALWTARCDDNRQWAIFVAPNGDLQVRNCADMERLDLPRCRELPPAPPQQPRARPKAGGN